MGSLILPMILLGIILIFGAIFLIVNSKQAKKGSIEKETKKSSKNSGSKKETGKVEDVPREDVFKFMEFDRILNNMIVQNKGTKFTMAIKCKGSFESTGVYAGTYRCGGLQSGHGHWCQRIGTGACF